MSKLFYGLFLIIPLSLAPEVAHGQVLVSEIAWMGNSAATNAHYCEWVELHNQGAERVSLSGWKLSTADGGMNVSLTGSIDPGAYFVVERYTATACPDPVPGISDLSVSFGSGLANTGEILVLTGAGQEQDRVDASSGWEDTVGGDATKKLTAQRNGTEWVTAEPTPGAVNATVSAATEEESTTITSSSSGSTKKVTNPIPYLVIEPGKDRVVSVGAHVAYRATVHDSKSEIRNRSHITWAFGDGGREIGREVSYKYDEPGEYLVVARAQDGYSDGHAYFTVVADTADVTVSSSTEKGIELWNQNDRIVDLSRWLLSSGGETYRLPEDTWILPGRRVWFLSSVTGLKAGDDGALLYPDEKVAAVLTQPGALASGSH